LIMMSLSGGIRGLAEYFATPVPNRKNGELSRFFAENHPCPLGSIAKHWEISL